jgi:hypothetical protein
VLFPFNAALGLQNTFAVGSTALFQMKEKIMLYSITKKSFHRATQQSPQEFLARIPPASRLASALDAEFGISQGAKEGIRSGGLTNQQPAYRSTNAEERIQYQKMMGKASNEEVSWWMVVD